VLFFGREYLFVHVEAKQQVQGL